MLPDRVSNPEPLTYQSGALPIALRGPARLFFSPEVVRIANDWGINPIAFRKAKIVYNFGISECNRVKSTINEITNP